MIQLIVLIVLLWPGRAGAECTDSPGAATRVDDSLLRTVKNVNRQVHCSDFKRYNGPGLHTNEIKLKTEALFHITHSKKKFEQLAREVSDALQKGEAVGVAGFVHEGNAVLVKDSNGKVQLLSVRHAVVEDVLGRNLSVSRTGAPPIAMSDTVALSPDLIEIESSGIRTSLTQDFAVIHSPRLQEHSSLALEVRDLEEPLLLDEPVVLAGYQDDKLKTFSCVYRGFSKEDFKLGDFQLFLKCDNENILLGGISGGVILDRAGRAVAVFNGIYRQGSSMNSKNFIRATPISRSSSGSIALEPNLKGDTLCAPCFSINGSQAFDGILNGTNLKRSSCLISREDGRANLRFDVLD